MQISIPMTFYVSGKRDNHYARFRSLCGKFLSCSLMWGSWTPLTGSLLKVVVKWGKMDFAEVMWPWLRHGKLAWQVMTGDDRGRGCTWGGSYGTSTLWRPVIVSSTYWAWLFPSTRIRWLGGAIWPVKNNVTMEINNVHGSCGRIYIFVCVFQPLDGDVR